MTWAMEVRRKKKERTDGETQGLPIRTYPLDAVVQRDEQRPEPLVFRPVHVLFLEFRPLLGGLDDRHLTTRDRAFDTNDPT